MEESQTLHGREEYRLYSFYLHRSHHRPNKLSTSSRDDYSSVQFSFSRQVRLLVTPLPGLSSGWLSCCLSSLRRLPSAGASHCGIAFCASRPSGWLSRLLASHAATSHLPAVGASASHRTVASYRAPLGPLVQLVKASPLLTPPPEDCA
jgi:hypothetical protein